ncbi:hypothetical protein CLV58_101178 [Spirosoma oryzae]|uniref:Uncharacterized protein n=1 Tax=Spirosoma oryzae TaxID=1469603 RepID=A0A2T0TN16_9BACT|nr:hypothetical protein CLV58_101178 [Spirosoma oryzae]
MESATGVRGDRTGGPARATWLTTNRNTAQILDQYIIKAEAAFIARAKAAGLVLTGEMLNSFRRTAATEANGYVEARLEMVGYFRLRDLRSMNYTRTPPLAAIERFVEEKGLNKFAYVPGYPTKNLSRPASDLATVERIAWAIKMNRQRLPNISRGYRGIYSDPLLSDVLPYLFRDLTDQTFLTAMRGVRLLFSQQ